MELSLFVMEIDKRRGTRIGLRVYTPSSYVTICHETKSHWFKVYALH